MLRIIILGKGNEQSAMLFQRVQEILRKNKINCELAHTADGAKLSEMLLRNIKVYDVLVLDIQNEKAFTVAQTLRNSNMTSSLLFVGGKMEEVQNLFLYRPSGMSEEYESDQFAVALIRCCKEQNRFRRYFVVRNKEVLMRVDFDEITYIESRQRIVIIHTKQRAIEFYGKLVDVLTSLPQDQFVRCHQSYIVNLEYVRALNKTERVFVLRSQEKIEISKSYYGQMQEQVERYLHVM